MSHVRGELLSSLVNLWAILISVMFVASATGTDCNAISYWNELGNNAFNLGNITFATYCYNKAIELANLNQPNAPIFNEIAIQCRYHMDAVDKNNSTHVFSKICSEQISTVEDQQNSNGLTLSFDVSNPSCKQHIRIGNIYINVIKYNSTWNSKILENFGYKPKARYFCNIAPDIGFYKCIQKFKDDEFIDLAPGELENFAINVITDMPGIYKMSINLEYAIGSETNRIIVGDVPGVIGFFDKDIE